MEKTVLITGASRGIGKAFAEVFAKNGYRLLLVARNIQEMEQIQLDLKNRYQCESKLLALDLAKAASIDVLIEHFKDEIPRLDVLVNNAGFGTTNKFHQMPAEEVEGMLGVNVFTLTKLTYHVLPHMLARKAGNILNVASTGAWGSGPYMAEYYATKAYVASFSQALYEEYKREGVIVSTLFPGFTRTDFARRAGTDKTALPTLTPNSTAEEVAEAGYKGMIHSRRVIVVGIQNKIIRLLMWLTPDFILAKILGMLEKPTT